MAGVRGLELRNVGANYPFERSRGFPGIKPNSGHRDYSRYLPRRYLDTRRATAHVAGVEGYQVALATYPPANAGLVACRRFEAAKGFRRLKAYKQLPVLRAALAAHQSKYVTQRVEHDTDAA